MLRFFGLNYFSLYFPPICWNDWAVWGNILIGDWPCRLLALVSMLLEFMFPVVKLDDAMNPCMVFAAPVVAFLLIPTPMALCFPEFCPGDILPIAEATP